METVANRYSLPEVTDILDIDPDEIFAAGRAYRTIELADSLEAGLAEVLTAVELDRSETTLRSELEGFTRYTLEKYAEDAPYVGIDLITKHYPDEDLMLVEFALALSRQGRPDLSTAVTDHNLLKAKEAIDLVRVGEALAYAELGEEAEALDRLCGLSFPSLYVNNIQHAVHQRFDAAKTANN